MLLEVMIILLEDHEKQSVAQHIHTSSYTDSNTSCVLYHYFGPSSLILQYVSRPTH